MLSTPVLSIIKYSFLSLVVTGAGFLIANTAVTMRYKGDVDKNTEKEQDLGKNIEQLITEVDEELHAQNEVTYSMETIESSRDNSHQVSELLNFTSNKATTQASDAIHETTVILQNDVRDIKKEDIEKNTEQIFTEREEFLSQDKVNMRMKVVKSTSDNNDKAITEASDIISESTATLQSEEMERLVYSVQPSPRDASLSLDRNSLLCLIQPSKPFCLMSSKKRLKLLRNRHLSFPEEEKPGGVNGTPLYQLLKDFAGFARAIGVTPVLLEPSILFCMLPTLQKYSVIANNLRTKILHGTPNIVTFGVLEKDYGILTQETSLNNSLDMDFEFKRFPSFPSLQDQNGEFMDASFSFSRQNLTVTVIMFFQRETFMWHPGTLEKESIPLQFSSGQAFENFTAVPFLLEEDRHSGFYLPSEVPHFLLQVQRSEFEECWSLPATDDILALHPTLNQDQLYQRTLIAIQELKSILRPVLGHFWLWNKTLSGWNESCNIFQKTSEFNVAIAVPVSIVPKMDLRVIFMDNEYLDVVEYHTWDDLFSQIILDCYGLNIRITVIYEDHDSMWNYEQGSTGDPIRNFFPNLQLCSTSVLGQLVHKPCSNQVVSGSE